MDSGSTQGSLGTTNREKAAEVCRGAIHSLNEILGEEVHLRYQDVDRIENKIVQLRDLLIEAWRNSSEGPGELHACLEKVNAALSLVVGVEYPAAGFQEKPLEMSRQILEGCMEEYFTK